MLIAVYQWLPINAPRTTSAAPKFKFKAPLDERRVSGDRTIGMVLSRGDSLHARAVTAKRSVHRTLSPLV